MILFLLQVFERRGVCFHYISILFSDVRFETRLV